MYKEKYERTQLEIFKFQADDIIKTSGYDEYEGWNPYDNGQGNGSEYEGWNPYNNGG